MEITEKSKLMGNYKENINVMKGSQLDFNGMILGNIIVEDSSTGIINGLVYGNIKIMPGAKAEINGSIHGTIYNHGGELAVYGTVNRIVTIAGETVIDTNAIVRKINV